MKLFFIKIERWLWITLLLSVFFIQIKIPNLNELVFAKNQNDEKSYVNFLWKVLEEVRRDYIDKEKTSMETLVTGAIKGLLNELGDPHTVYLAKEQYREITTDALGFFGGLGFYIDQEYNHFIIVEVIEDTPAWKAGIKKGDIIYKIEGKIMEEMTLNQVASLLKGPINTAVNLTIYREGSQKPIYFKITRQKIKIKSVVYQSIEEEKIGYINIRKFSKTTLKDTKLALKDLLNQGDTSFIIDLRYNPGGLLETACDIADLFIAGSNIVHIKNRHDKVVEEFNASSNVAISPQFPIAILINRYSASASEILAGAMQDHRRAILLGESTFGKFSVQEIREIDALNQTAYKITVAYYYLPSGRNLHLKGLDPDIFIKPHSFDKSEIKKMNKKTTKKLVADYVKRFKKKESDNNNRFLLQKELKEEGIDINLDNIDFLINTERYQNQPAPIFDIKFDRQLKEAVKILKGHQVLSRNKVK